MRTIASTVLRGQRTLSVGSVRYRERTGEPLHRALSSRGAGHKEYDVFFPSSAAMRIRCTAERQYADIVGERLVRPYELADPIVRPGMRVLDARSGTGFGAARLAACVGSSGGVVALEHDHESVRFARRRYDTSNVSFEIGGVESLRGELDGSFDAVIAVHALRIGEDHGRVLAALWRVLAAGAPMLLVQPLRLPDEVRFGPPAPEEGARADTCRMPRSLRLSSAELGNLLLGLEPSPLVEPSDAVDFAAIIARKARAGEGPRVSREPAPPYPPMR